MIFPAIGVTEFMRDILNRFGFSYCGIPAFGREESSSHIRQGLGDLD